MKPTDQNCHGSAHPILRCLAVSKMCHTFTLQRDLLKSHYTETHQKHCKYVQDGMTHVSLVEIADNDTLYHSLVPVGHSGMAVVTTVTCQVALNVMRRTLGKRSPGSRTRKPQEGRMHSTKSRRNVKVVSLRHSLNACAQVIDDTPISGVRSPDSGPITSGRAGHRCWAMQCTYFCGAEVVLACCSSRWGEHVQEQRKRTSVGLWTHLKQAFHRNTVCGGRGKSWPGKLAVRKVW